MKFTVQPSDLKAAFSAVKSVVPSKPAMPVLENILLRPDGDSAVTLMASDTDNVITARMVVEDAEGLVPFLIPANRLGDYIGNAMGDWPVMVETVDDEISLGDGFGDFRFFGSADIKYYPQTPELKADGMTVTVDAARLVEVASIASKFTGKDELRPVMSGVCLDFRSDGLRVAASDSKVLFFDVLREVSAERDAAIIVNTSVISAMVSHCSPSEPMDVSFDSRSVRFRQSGFEVQGRLIEGKFPRFEAVIPKNNNRQVEISRNLLASAVKRVSISANKSTNQVRLRFDGGEHLTLEASDIDFSLHSDMTIATKPQVDVPGGHLTAVRASFFLSVLGTFGKDVEDIVLFMGDPNRAILVKRDMESERVALIMPMQVLD